VLEFKGKTSKEYPRNFAHTDANIAISPNHVFHPGRRVHCMLYERSLGAALALYRQAKKGRSC